MEAKSREHCKIRKRGNSSSSSSSLIQKYRFKRAILVGKRGGSTTPVPTWKKSPTLSMPNAESTNCPPSQSGAKAKEPSVSARKLAATLWEINNMPSPRVRKDLETVTDNIKELRSREKVAKFPHLSDPSYTPISEKMDRSRRNGHRRRASVVRKKVEVTDYNAGGLDSVSNASLMEIETHSKGIIGIKTRLKDVSNGLITSKELVKVLKRILGLDEQHSSGMSLVSALRVELDRARLQVDQLIKEQRCNRNEIDFLLKQFEEEKAAWKSKERDRIRNAIACIAEELEVEKKLRRQTERLNKKLGKELAATKASLSQALKELDSEKRAKEILEQVCDELARGIGEDRAEVEELKRESAKVREEIEKEREMLQLVDVLREERVQMKLSEAKYHFEEKNAAVERLRNELESYLKEKVLGKENGHDSPNYDRIKELEAYLKEIQNGLPQRTEKVESEGVIENGEVHDGDDSADSDLHSIELNMDNNSKSYKWSYACDSDAFDNLKRVSVDRDFMGRKSISENIQWGSICLQRRNSNSIDVPDWDFITKNQEKSDVFDGERLSEVDIHSQTQETEDEIMRYRSLKSLGDHILSSSKRQPIQNFASPARQWEPLQDVGSAVSDGSPVLQGDSLKPRVTGARGGRRTLTSSRH
ncbi:uncharacterized protein At5g41620 isoform X2 [Manihot esculenta]|uniref:Uncharacterized protein n=1 Tax=Manihot esculenta TaxID=3983 RepID=A0ACB7GXR5_MANES|nr:uncharacterized protein At5g41620 isoform X2 [Manihot esculenta]KAG8644775.1 hypothetical protein MANES_11G164600v8 [Manihot esculenta]